MRMSAQLTKPTPRQSVPMQSMSGNSDVRLTDDALDQVPASAPITVTALSCTSLYRRKTSMHRSAQAFCSDLIRDPRLMTSTPRV